VTPHEHHSFYTLPHIHYTHPLHYLSAACLVFLLLHFILPLPQQLITLSRTFLQAYKMSADTVGKVSQSQA
jgi:hypothetical protein